MIRIFVARSTFRNAAKGGLFGLLGDTPIQIVDVSDEPRIDAFFDFANLMPRDSSERGKAFNGTLRNRSRPS